MKNILFFLVIILLLLFTYIGKLFYASTTTNTGLNHLIPSSNRISKQLIENYRSSDEEIKKKSSNKIKEIVLKDIEYENWFDYIEYIEIMIYPADIVGSSEEDLIISLNISKDTGIIAIYKPFNDYYLYTGKIENLTHINDVVILKDTANDKSYIFVEQTLDERLGAFFIDNYIQGFVKENNSFLEVFRQSLNYEGYYYEKWTDPSIENPKWIKLKEQNLIDYFINENSTLVINLTKSLYKFEGYNYNDDSIPENFQLVQEKNFKIKYYWSNKYNYFIQYEGRIKSTNTPVGIIEHSNQFVDSLLGLYELYYKIIHKNGKIDYINSNELNIIQNNTFQYINNQ